MSQVPLKDPRRCRAGNRTIRMPHSAWLQYTKSRAEFDARRQMRALCRLPIPTEYLWRSQDRDAEILHNFIHDSHLGTPAQVRKRFPAIIRAMIKTMRDKQARRRSFAQIVP